MLEGQVDSTLFSDGPFQIFIQNVVSLSEFVAFLSPSRQVLGCYIEIGHNNFLACTSLFTVCHSQSSSHLTLYNLYSRECIIKKIRTMTGLNCGICYNTSRCFSQSFQTDTSNSVLQKSVSQLRWLAVNFFCHRYWGSPYGICG